MDNNREVPFAFHSLRVGSLKQCDRLVRQEPILESNADLLHAFHSAYTRGQISTEEAAIRSLIRQPAYRAQSQIDGPRREFASLEMHAVPQHNGSVE